MPLPKPNPDSENQAEWTSHCMSDSTMSLEYEDRDQRLAICSSLWEQEKVVMSPNEKLLRAIKARQQKQTEFAYGIITADVYVRTLPECIGLDACYKYAATRQTSFDDVMKKAAKTLVYSNDEMEIEWKGKDKVKELEGIEMPKNTLMAFRHVLTTARKDRDGDIMRTKGAIIDPKMLLLWQHIHTLPIGKMLAVAEQTDKSLSLISVIVDMNELSHDAAVMVDNGMARFSHGFRALEFTEMKMDGDEKPSGFDVKKFEIMEESMVSVPANVDADTEEILLSLVEGGKLKSPLMKQVGRSLREKSNIVVPGVKIDYTERSLTCGSLQDLKAAHDAGLIGEKNDANKSRDGSEEARGSEGKPTSTPEETNDTKEAAEESEDPQVKYMGSLEGSWEWIGGKLRAQAKPYLATGGIGVGERDWVYIFATYPDHAIVCLEKSDSGVEDEYRHFRIAWKMEKKEPLFTGEIKQVDVVTSVESHKMSPLYQIKHGTEEKAGRSLSKANEGKIKEANDNISEAIGIDGVPRAAKALLREASRDLSSVLTSIAREEVPSEDKDVAVAMSTVLIHATPEQQRTVREALLAIEKVSKQKRITEHFRVLRT